MTKTLDDIEADMTELYEQLKNDQVKVKVASELANIAGKFLKANQLRLAWLHFDRMESDEKRLIEERALELTADAA